MELIGICEESEKLKLARTLAYCIVLAEVLSGMGQDQENDEYWYTREACVEIARKNGISCVKVVKLLSDPEFTDAKWRPKYLMEMTKTYFPQVCHPDILLKSVLEV